MYKKAYFVTLFSLCFVAKTYAQISQAEKDLRILGEFSTYFDAFDMRTSQVNLVYTEGESMGESHSTTISTDISLNFDVSLSIPFSFKGGGGSVQILGQSRGEYLSISNSLVSSIGVSFGDIELDPNKPLQELDVDDYQNMYFTCSLSNYHTNSSSLTIKRSGTKDEHYIGLKNFSLGFFGALGISLSESTTHSSSSSVQLTYSQKKDFTIAQSFINHIKQLKKANPKDWKDLVRKELMSAMANLGKPTDTVQANMISLAKLFCFKRYTNMFKGQVQERLRELIVSRLFEKSNLSCYDDNQVKASDVAQVFEQANDLDHFRKDYQDQFLQSGKITNRMIEGMTPYVLANRESKYNFEEDDRLGYEVINKCERQRQLSYSSMFYGNSNHYISVCIGKEKPLYPGSSSNGGSCQIRAKRGSTSCLLIQDGKLKSGGTLMFERYCEPGYICKEDPVATKKQLDWLQRNVWGKKVGRCVRADNY